MIEISKRRLLVDGRPRIVLAGELIDLKTRLHVAQGVRLINYYLLAGGINPPLDVAVHDGNDRLSFTGDARGHSRDPRRGTLARRR